MELVYIEQPSILLFLDEALNIINVGRVRRNQRFDPCIIQVERLRATAHREPEITADYFTTDPLGCIRLLLWITNERPDASAQANLNRFERLFSNNPTDAIIAAMRIYAGREEDAAGETSFFISQQWTHHPAEMTAIKALGGMR